MEFPSRTISSFVVFRFFESVVLVAAFDGEELRNCFKIPVRGYCSESSWRSDQRTMCLARHVLNIILFLSPTVVQASLFVKQLWRHSFI